MFVLNVSKIMVQVWMGKVVQRFPKIKDVSIITTIIVANVKIPIIILWKLIFFKAIENHKYNLYLS